MKAVWYDRTGGPEVLTHGEMPTPSPGPGEVLVRLATSGVNPSDWKSRSGATGRPMGFPRVVPHSDGAGTVEAVGEGVDRGRVGERVWIWNGQWKRAFGTAAECIALPSEQAVRLPGNTGFDEGACLGIPALTALHALLTDGGVSGRRVLVTGGSQGATARRSRSLPSPPRSFERSGSPAAQSTSRCDRKGTRTSSECAMLVRSTLASICPGSCSAASAWRNCSRSLSPAKGGSSSARRRSSAPGPSWRARKPGS